MENNDVDILPEYDLRGRPGVVRGKYYKRYWDGHAVHVEKPDGSVSVQYFALEDGAVVLDRDVREYFRDSESVNQALRALIALIPKRQQAGIRSK
jgi:hypothetical protein